MIKMGSEFQTWGAAILKERSRSVELDLRKGKFKSNSLPYRKK